MSHAPGLDASRVHMIVSGLEYLAQGFSIFDRELRLVAWNGHFLELLDFPAELGSFGRPLADFFRFNALRGDYGPGEVDEQVESRLELARKAAPHCFERVRPNGTVLEVRGTPLPGGGFVTTYTDVTDRKTWEDSLQAARLAAEEANHAKSAFLNMVTHDLRTPLTSIRLFAEILRDDPQLDPQQRVEFLGVIDGECQRMVRMINNLLDFAKIEAGRMEWVITEIDPAELVRTALGSLHAIFVDKGVTVELSLPEPAPRVRGDRDRLTQVLINLLSNALKFVPQGSGRILVGLADGGAGADELTVSVADNGPGIAPEKHEEVFEEFRQVVGAGGAKPAGTGLGLAICRRIVEHLGGRIWVEGVPPEGATFRFTLPREPGA